MKKYLKSFIHQPKKVIIVSLIIAIIIGIFGYSNIHKIPKDEFTGNDNSIIRKFPINFSTSGKVKDVLITTGQKVKKGEILATLDPDQIDGSLIQARAAYETAKANYQKVMNGATGTAVDVAKAAVNTAKVNLDEVTKQQEILVDNAYTTLLNSSLQAQSVSNFDAYDSPTITGTYTCKKEGSYDLEVYLSSGGVSVSYSGLETGNALLTDVPRSLGNCGLFVSFDKSKQISSSLEEFNVQIPNKSAVNYNSNNNAYELALQTKNQTIAVAQAALDQANASLNSVVANARPEDVAAAQAQVENAYGALIANPGYNNTVITSPSDGTVTDIYITPGENVDSNKPAIEFLGL